MLLLSAPCGWQGFWCPNVLSVAVGVAGGESVRNMFLLRSQGYVVGVAAVRVVVVHVAPRVEAPAVYAVLTVIVVVPVVGVRRARFAVLDQKVGIADPESPDAATVIPCCLMPCDVFFFFCCSCCCC